MRSNFSEYVMGRLGDTQYTPAQHRSEEGYLVNAVQRTQAQQTEAYIKSLLYPEIHAAKVPSMLPAESAIASLRWNGTITPNATGKFLYVLDPFQNTGFLYQDAGVNGTGGGTVTNISMPFESTIVDEFRLVSCCLTLNYWASFSNMQGYMVGVCVSNRDAATPTTFLTFDNIENIKSKKMHGASEGIKLIFTPDDSEAMNFRSLTSYSGNTHPCKWQYLLVVYGDNMVNGPALRWEVTKNIEYKSKLTLREYISHDTYPPCETPSAATLPKIHKPISGNSSSVSNNSSLRNPLGIQGMIDINADMKEILKQTAPGILNKILNVLSSK